MNKKDVRRTARVIVSALAILVAAGLLGLTGYTIARGTERWAVKTGGDVDAGLVDLSNPVVSSVSKLNTFQRPGPIPRMATPTGFPTDSFVGGG
jgi:hypothetical protein